MHSKTPGGIVPVNSNLQPQYDIRYLFTGRIPPPSVSVGPDIRPFSRFLHRSQESFQALCSPDNRQALLLFVPFLQAPLLHLEESASFYFIKSCSVCTQTAEGFSKSQSCFFFYAFYHFQIWKLPRIFVCIKTAFCKSVIKKH